MMFTIEIIQLATGICSRCSSRAEQILNVCEDHDAATGVCENCLKRHAVRVDYSCSNCTKVEKRIPLGLHLHTTPELQSFAAANGINLARPNWEDNSFLIGYEETELSTDPFRVTLAYETDDNHIDLTVNENLDVIEIGP